MTIEPGDKDIICGIDGYFYFWPTANRGGFNAQQLREIADHLDELNKPWDAQVQAEVA